LAPDPAVTKFGKGEYEEICARYVLEAVHHHRPVGSALARRENKNL
jgi:hypothetical protein